MKDLNKEFKECMEETKAYYRTLMIDSSLSCMDEGDIVENVKAMRLIGRVMDLCGDLLERHISLTEKMDKALDKYLEG